MGQIKYINIFYRPSEVELSQNYFYQAELRDFYKKLDNYNKYDAIVAKQRVHDKLRNEIKLVQSNN